MSNDDQGAVHCEIIRHVALITLERPRALNAPSHAMVLRLHALLGEDGGLHACFEVFRPARRHAPLLAR